VAKDKGLSMPVVYSSNTGRVISITDEVAAGAISLASVAGDVPITYASHRTIITRLGVSAAGNYQFLHTIGNDVYVYVFGDRMGQIVIHGLSFAQQCPNETTHGFEKMLQWYEENRIAVRKAPVTATIGNKKSFQGFVTGLSGDAQDAMHRTIQFQLTISLLPDALA